MISSWSVTNFKSIREQVALHFAPLTLFAGENSAGKSTLIQNILLTAQTLQSSVVSRSVILNGRLARLGTFNDIRSNSGQTNSISVLFELKEAELEQPLFQQSLRVGRYYYVGSGDYHRTMAATRCAYSFSGGSGESEGEAFQLQPRLESGSVTFISSNPDTESVEFSFARHGESREQVLSRVGVTQLALNVAPSSLDYRVTSVTPLASTRYYRGPRNSTNTGVVLRHFLPAGIAVAFDKVAEQVDSTYEALTEPNARYMYGNWGEPSTELLKNETAQKIYTTAVETVAKNAAPFMTENIRRELTTLKNDFSVLAISRLTERLPASIRKELQAVLAEQEQEMKLALRGARPPSRELTVVPPAGPIAFASDYITTFFSERVRYLGPLRDEPKPVYPLSGQNDPNDVGLRGEHTAAVLDTHRNTEIRFISSKAFPFSKVSDIIVQNNTLGQAVSDWLAYIGIGDDFDTADKGKLGHELKVVTSRGSELHDLTHVGVGVSQALPILVLSLLAEPGSTLIFEQPELHLHPRVQTRLADFFVSLIFSGKQCIVETHSEYLVSRLRYLAALAEDTQIVDKLKMYFVEKDADQSVYKEVEMSERGVIANWPGGFFDETERNAAAILEAQLRKSKTKLRKLNEKKS